MAKQLNVSLAFQADTSQARAQIQDLQKTLSQLLSSSASNSNSLGLNKELQTAIGLASDLNKFNRLCFKLD